MNEERASYRVRVGVLACLAVLGTAAWVAVWWSL